MNTRFSRTLVVAACVCLPSICGCVWESETTPPSTASAPVAEPIEAPVPPSSDDETTVEAGAKAAESEPIDESSKTAEAEATQPEEAAEAVASDDDSEAPKETQVAPAPVAESRADEGQADESQATAGAAVDLAPIGIGPADWGQWGGNTIRNNVVDAENIPSEWAPGKFDRKSGVWQSEQAKSIKWVVRLGSQSYGNPVVANGRVYVGTNNGAGYLSRYPSSSSPDGKDLGCLLCFNEADGKFLWQHSSEKLPSGRVNDWPDQGICCAPLVEGDRLWFVTSRGEVACLDTEGFHDNENDGPYKEEKFTEADEADAVWYLDMMGKLGVFQHNMCSCSVTAVGDVLFVCTSNGVDESHVNIPAPNAPSFIAIDKNSGEVLWTDASPGINIVHGQWSSPSVAVMGGVPQVLFGGGDGFLYSFHATEFADGKPQLLWKFDCNPKEAKFALGGRGTRNDIIGTPLYYDGLVYQAVGQDPEHGEGVGHLWCIDPTKRGDVSSELAFNLANPNAPIPHKRLQAVEPDKGDVARPNENSALVWRYSGFDSDGNGKLKFEETMHRSCGTVAIKQDAQGNHLLFVADFSGLFHCLDAKSGKPYWTYDMLAASWGSPLIVDDKVYIGDEDGDVAVFPLSADPQMALKDVDGELKPALAEINMGNAVYTTPIVANGVLYIANRTHLFAIQAGVEAAAATGGGE